MTVLAAGVDDAGRGSIIGPLVIAGVLHPSELADELWKLGVKDSKRLTPARRSRLAERIKEAVEAYEIVEIPPSKIEKTALISTAIVTALFLSLYYLPYGIAHLSKNLGPLDPLAHIPNPIKYVLSANIAIILIVLITLRIQIKAQTAVKIRKKKAIRKR